VSPGDALWYVRRQRMDTDVAIIGGGAAGLTAAIFASEGGARVTVLDGAKVLGAKILVSGGGRCNVTHHEVRAADFNGPQNVVRNVLAAFDVGAAVRWFASIGVELKREPTGKLFPVSDSAKTVVAALLRRCGELGVEIRTGCKAIGIKPPPSATTDNEPLVTDTRPYFSIEHAGGGGPLLARRVIVSTGGRSLPRSGSDGSGWGIVQTLGHSVTPTYAALAPLVLAPQIFHADCSGISHEVELSTVVGGKPVDRRTGSLLWTHFGISGPVVMDASRHWIIPHELGQRPELLCGFLPGEPFERVERWLVEAGTKSPKASVGGLIAGRLPERVGTALVRHVSIDPATPLGQFSRDARRALVHALTALPLPVVGHRGWNYAEVTAGGVPLNEVDFRTMASRKVPGLYLAGEVLDCDGRIGGFNFQWAWATGYLAGRAAGTM